MAKQPKRKTMSSEIARIHLDLMDTFQRAVDREDKSAEQQVKFFISLITAVIAIIAVLQKLGGLEGPQLFWVVQTSLAVLFLFGLLTLARINWRSVNSAKLSPLIRHTHKSMRKLDSSFVPYLDLWDEMKEQEKSANWFLRKIQGSLAQFMTLSQCLIATGLALNLFIYVGTTSTIELTLISLLAFLATSIPLLLWARYVRSIIDKLTTTSTATA